MRFKAESSETYNRSCRSSKTIFLININFLTFKKEKKKKIFLINSHRFEI